MGARRVEKLRGPLDATLQAVPSKSVTHRALVTAALADGETLLLGPLDADDTQITREGLVALGIDITSEPGRWTVRGRGGRIRGAGAIALGGSGTSMRLLTAVAALGSAPSRLDGAARLRERPLGDLLTALRSLGGEIHADPGTAGIPLLAGGGAIRGGRVNLPGRRSSQFASALLLIAPRLPGGIDLRIDPPAVSLPYVELTAAVLSAFDVSVTRLSERHWRVNPGAFSGREYRIEGDHSSASYFLAAAAVCGGRVRLAGLDPCSKQADARLVILLEELGCNVDAACGQLEVRASGEIPVFDIDLSDAPDLVPTVAVLGLFADGPCVIRGVTHLRYKESDRLEMLARNLRALGRDATALEDRLVIGRPPPCLGGGRIATA